MTDRATDAEDPALDPFRDVRERDLRGRSGGFMVESPRVVMRFLDAVQEGRYALEDVVVVPELAPELTDRLEGDARRFVRCTESVLTSISGYRFHAGAMAIGRRPTPAPTLAELWRRCDASGPLTVIMLAGITSMDNIGSIFRSVAALGGDAIVLDGRCGDPLLRRCLRISMGQVFRVPWFEVDRISIAMEGLRSRDVTICGVENTVDAIRIDDRPLPGRTALIIGNEGHGISTDILASCDEVRRIPGPENLPAVERPGGEDERSLNAGVACAIALHEAMRARRG